MHLGLAIFVASLAALSLAQDLPLPYTYPATSLPNTTPLYFGLLQSFGGTYDSSGTIPGVELALDYINRNQTLLPGYTLHYVLRDSFCDRTIALESLHRLLFEDPVKIAIMGCGCSPATEPTAEIDHYYNLTHISCISSSIALSNRTRYRAYYQMLPSEADIAIAVVGGIQFYGWRYIAIITQNENILTLTVDSVTDKLRNMSINYSEKRFETHDGVGKLSDTGNLFDPNARIFYIATFTSHARDIICLAHKKEYRYPEYMFLTYAWYPPQWWNNDNDTADGNTTESRFSCSAEERLEVLNLTLAFLHFPFVRFGVVNASTDVQLTGFEYMQKVEAHVNQEPLNLSLIEGAGFCYDATWTLANALSSLLNGLSESESLRIRASNASGINSTEFSLENFNYQNHVIQQLLQEKLSDTDFIGVTGEVKFKKGIRDVDALRVLQIRLNSSGEYDWIKIGTVMFDTENDGNITNITFTYANGFTDEAVFPAGIPYDGIPRSELVTIHPALTGIIALLVAAGLVFSIVCLSFNIIYRKRKLIRLSSPNLNYIICMGAIILYLDMLLLVIPSTDGTVVSILCNITPWFTSIGYSLCYGTILVKMFRVYYIYSNPSPRKKNKKIIKDQVLILLVFCMVAIDIIIITIYLGVEGSQDNLEAQRVRNVENREDVEGVRQITTEFFTFACNSRGRKITLGILYGYKSLLQILSLFLAFATRRVKVKGLNDTKAVAAAVYITSITFTVLFVSTYTVVEYINVYAAIFCMAFFIGTTSILALLYIPNMVSLYQDPQGLTVFKTENTAVATGTSADKTTIETLRRRIRELENVVSQNVQSPRSESTSSSHHLVPPPHHSKRLSTSSDISLDTTEGREHKTIWDNGSMAGDRNGTNKDSTTL